jgi:hypothetical protein
MLDARYLMLDCWPLSSIQYQESSIQKAGRPENRKARKLTADKRGLTQMRKILKIFAFINDY